MSLYTVSYTLTGLDPFTSYTIRVTVHNGVSDQDAAGKVNRQCEVTTTTSKLSHVHSCINYRDLVLQIFE